LSDFSLIAIDADAAAFRFDDLRRRRFSLLPTHATITTRANMRCAEEARAMKSVMALSAPARPGARMMRERAGGMLCA
jgi:hypothetical protein